MDVKFLNPFINATVNVLSTMARVNPKPRKPYLKKERTSSGDVTGIIGLAGSGTKGFFAVSFSNECILNIVYNMLQEEVRENSAELADAVGEITNMISGGGRAELVKHGINLDMAIPSVIMGKGHAVAHMTDLPIICVPFDTEKGSFEVEACLQRVK